MSSSDPLAGDLGLSNYSSSRSRSQAAPPRPHSAQPPALSAAAPPLPAPQTLDRPLNPKRQTLTRRISFPTDHLDPTLTARLSRYLVTFALVDFDIDTGPNLDNAYPPIRFPPSIRANIAFSSLPEGDLPSTSSLSPTPSSSTAAPGPGEGGYAYHWRIPYPDETALRREETQTGKEYARLPESEDGDGALHGFVWFVQEKDERIRRGYSQRSLVLITHLPSHPGLFSSIVSILGPLHFKHAQHPGAKGGMIESACYNIGAWPDPIPGTTVDLPLLGTVLTVALPLPSQAQFPAATPAYTAASLSLSSSTPRGARRAMTHPPSPFLSSSAPGSPAMGGLDPTAVPPTLPSSLPLTPLCLLLFPPYSSSPTAGGVGKVGAVGFTKLLLLWELLVLGEPVLVYSNEPRVGAEVVEHLRGLVRPLPFAGDIRPYFHVHDHDFSTLCKPGSKPPPNTLLASSNPLVLRNCRAWPHVLRLDRASPSPPSLATPASSSPRLPPSVSSSSAARAGHARSGSVSRSNSLKVGEEGRDFGLRSERKRHVRKDEGVARRVEEAWAQGDYLACDLLLYQHLTSLSERFLAPLNRYFGTLWAGSGGLPLASPSTALSPGPQPMPSTRFDPAAFVASLKQHGSSLPLKPSLAPSFSQPSTTPVERFYLRFLRVENANAREWERARTRDVGGEVRRRYLKRLEESRAGGEGRVREGMERLNLSTTPSSTPVPVSSFASSLSNAGLGISSPSSSLSTGFDTLSPSPSSRLPIQAERIRSLRDSDGRTVSVAGTASSYESSTE
ncbi:hypothetical protein JCM8097_000067 [Rhodosporidiobolus ruineniae]